MFPVFTSVNVANTRRTKTILPRCFNAAHSVVSILQKLHDLWRCQFRLIVCLSPLSLFNGDNRNDRSPFANHIFHIALWGIWKQMIRINAWWIVTAMADKQRIRIKSRGQKISDAVSGPIFAAQPEASVGFFPFTVFPFPVFPNPTLFGIGSIYLCPEAKYIFIGKGGNDRLTIRHILKPILSVCAKAVGTRLLAACPILP